MKIAHLFYSLGYGGIETMLVNIANAQIVLGGEVSIVIINNIVTEELGEILSPEINLVCLNRKVGDRGLRYIKELNNSLDKINPDVIHLHSGIIFNYLNNHWQKKSHCVATLHAMPEGCLGAPSRWLRIVQNLVFHQGGNVMNMNRVEHVVSISNAVSRSLKSEFGIDSVVIHNGIHTHSFAIKKNRTLGKTFNIVQVSRLEHEKKGQDLLIMAARRLKEQYHVSLRVNFIGDGASMAFLQKLTTDLGMNNEVRFVGSKTQDYIKSHLCDYDLYVQPSRFEGFGLTVAEAMSAKLPVLVSSGQGPAEVTEEDRYGWTFKNNDPDNLAAVLLYIINNYDEAIAKTDEAYLHVCQNYDVNITALKYIELYDRKQ